MNNIEIHSSTKKGLLKWIGDPILFFMKLYRLLEAQYRIISNSIDTERSARIRFYELSDFFLESFQKIYKNEFDERTLEEIKKVVNDDTNNNLICLSLFKGLTDYLTVYRIETLKLLEPVESDGFIVTAKPPNPIYDTLPNPVREHCGTSIHDITEIFKYISVIKETGLKINLVKNERIKNTCMYLRPRVKQGFKIAVTPFMECITFDFGSLRDDWPANDKTPYWFRKMKNVKEAKKQLIEKILKPCVEKGVDILVLPELSIDEELLIFLKKWLKLNNGGRISSGKPGLLMVVGGSFHVECETGERFNTSTILNHSGDILWTQDKIMRFSFDKSDIQKKPELPTLLNTSPSGGSEHISQTNTICCVDTPVGRISVCICIDFFHEDLFEAYRQTKANIFLVPAMTPQVDKFLQASKEFARKNLAASFISNSGFAAKKEKSGIHRNGASFYFLPRNGENGVLAIEENKDLLIFNLRELIKG